MNTEEGKSEYLFRKIDRRYPLWRMDFAILSESFSEIPLLLIELARCPHEDNIMCHKDEEKLGCKYIEIAGPT